MSRNSSMNKIFKILLSILPITSIVHAQSWITQDTLDLTNTSEYVQVPIPVHGPVSYNGTDTLETYMAYHINTNNSTGIKSGDTLIHVYLLNSGTLYPHMSSQNSHFNLQAFTPSISNKTVKMINKEGNTIYAPLAGKLTKMGVQAGLPSRVFLQVTAVPNTPSIGGSFDAWALSPTPGFVADTLPTVIFPAGSNPSVADLLSAIPGSADCYTSPQAMDISYFPAIDAVPESSTELLSTDTAHYVTKSAGLGVAPSWKRSFVGWCVEDLIQVSTTTGSICMGETFTWRGQSYSSAGSYTDSVLYTNSGGCDSLEVYTLDLTVSSPPTVSAGTDMTVCTGDSVTLTGSGNAASYTWSGGVADGVAFVPTATGTYTVTGVQGACTVTDDIIVTVAPSKYSIFNHTICTGHAYFFGGQNLLTAGTYYDTLTSVQGCDSIVTLNLSVTPPKRDTLAQAICSGTTITWHGQTLSQPGFYSDTIKNSMFCDSIVTLGLVVLPTLRDTVSQAICDGTTITWQGQTLSQAGFYSDTLSTTGGCDSILTLDLTVMPTLRDTVDLQICDGDTITWHDMSLYQAGYYDDTLTASGGCDSILTLDLQVIPTTSDTVSQSICEGTTLVWQGQNLSQAGYYPATLSSSMGCDSLVTMHLQVLPNSSDTVSYNICKGSSLIWQGQTLNQTGYYPWVYTNSSGCDSLVTINLTVNPTDSVLITQSICDGTSLVWEGQTLTQAGTYTKTLTNSNGCDSILTLQLSILPTSDDTLTESICFGDTYTWQGQTLSQSGYYTATLTNGSGCDSVVTLDLEVLPMSKDTVSFSFCDGSVVNWQGQTYSQAGYYTDTLLTSSGCDSLSTLQLILLPSSDDTLSQAICPGGSYSWQGQSYNLAGFYTSNHTNSVGCDSILTLHLTIDPMPKDTFSLSMCSGNSIFWQGQSYSQAGYYSDTISTANCDSIATLHLMVLPVTHDTLAQSICSGGSYTWNGQSYSQAGFYTQNLTNTSGCDSLVTLALSILPATSDTVSQSICSGGSYAWNGQSYNQAGYYTQNLTNSNGCDSLVTLDLTVNPSTMDTVTAATCQGSSYTWQGQSYNQAGYYTQNLTNTNGCDSIVTLDLTINPATMDTVTAATCQGSSYTWQGQSYNQAGYYTQNLTNSNGCDSIVTLDLIILHESYDTIVQSICDGSTYSWQGQTYTQAGHYTTTLTNSVGCDSLLTLHLIVHPTYTDTMTQSICTGSVYNWQGQTYTQSGFYTASYTSTTGCDSVKTLDLNVHPVFIDTVSQSICDGSSVTWSGQTLNQTGYYTDTLLAAGGCDSIVTLDLSVLQPSSSTLTYDLCDGQTYNWYGQTITAAGNYTATIPNTAGCDSTMSLTVNLLQPSWTSVVDNFCINGSYTLANGQIITEPGKYTIQVPNSVGCDSVIEYQLKTLGSPKATGFTQTTTDTYTWDFEVLNPLDFTSVSWKFGDGSTGTGTQTSHTYTTKGIYYASVTLHNDCGDTTLYNDVIPVSVDDLGHHKVRIYPNPVVDHIYLENVNLKGDIKLYNVKGQRIDYRLESNILYISKELPAGVYMLRTEEGVFQFMKE